MTAQQFVALAVRMFSIWIFLYAMRIYVAALTVPGNVAGETHMMVLMMAVVATVVAIVLWCYPSVVAGKLLPRTAHGNVIKMPARHVAALAAATLGAWTVIDAIPYAVQAFEGMEYANVYSGGQMLVYLILPFLQFMAGVFLLAKPWSLARLVFPETGGEAPE